VFCAFEALLVLSFEEDPLLSVILCVFLPSGAA